MSEQPVGRQVGRLERTTTIALIAIGVLLVLFFGLRTVRVFRHGPPRPPQAELTDVELIRGWMPLSYIEHAYGLPHGYLFRALDVPFDDNDRKDLQRLARERNPDDPAAFVASVKQAILDFQSSPPPGPPDQGPPDQDSRDQKPPDQGPRDQEPTPP